MRLRELQRSFQNRVLRHRRGIESQLNDAQDEDFELQVACYSLGPANQSVPYFVHGHS